MRVAVPIEIAAEGRLPAVCAMTGEREGVSLERLSATLMVGNPGPHGALLYVLDQVTGISLPGTPEVQVAQVQIPLSAAGRNLLARRRRLRIACLAGGALLIGSSVVVLAMTLNGWLSLSVVAAGATLLFAGGWLARGLIHIRDMQSAMLILDLPCAEAAAAYAVAAAADGPPPPVASPVEDAPNPGIPALLRSPPTWLLVLALVALNFRVWGSGGKTESLIASGAAMALAMASLACPPRRRWVVIKVVAGGVAAAGLASLLQAGMGSVLARLFGR